MPSLLIILAPNMANPHTPARTRLFQRSSSLNYSRQSQIFPFVPVCGRKFAQVRDEKTAKRLTILEGWRSHAEAIVYHIIPFLNPSVLLAALNSYINAAEKLHYSKAIS